MGSTSQRISHISLNLLFLLQLASTSFSDGYHLEENPLYKKKQFPLAGNFVFTNQNEGFCWNRRFQ